LKRVGICTLSAAAAACGPTAEYTASQTLQPGVTLHSYSDDLQTAMIFGPDARSRFCLDPAPDVAAGGSDSIALNDGTADGISVSDQKSVVGLGGRTDLTLVTRELLYRACELLLNANLSPEDSLALYQETLRSILQISRHIHGSAAFMDTGNDEAGPD